MDAHFPDQLDQPPFPPLTWGDCDWWDGLIDLAFGSQASLVVGVQDFEASRIPSVAQAEALRFQLEYGEQVIASVLTALKAYYEERRPRYRDFLGDQFEILMPEVSELSELRKLIELCEVHVHPWEKDGIAYVGLQFNCTWDQEHGFGVQVHRERVASIGSAEYAFAWEPDELSEIS